MPRIVRNFPSSAALTLCVLMGCASARGAETLAPASAPEATEGVVAARDYFAPADFAVVDAAATAEAFVRAGEATPIVVHEDTSTAEAAVAQFNTAFDNARKAFLDALEATFGERQVGSREINSARFRNFRNDFQAANPLFPVNLVLAQTWAKGYDGEPARDRLVAAIRGVAQAPERFIGEIRPASTIFLTTLQSSDRVRTWGELAPHTRIIARGDMLSIETAGEQMRRGLDALDRTAGAFLTGLLQPNVVEDPVLTGLLFQEQFGARARTRHFREGEPIARVGERFDRWAVLALAHLRRVGLDALLIDPELSRMPETGAGDADRGLGARRRATAPAWQFFALVGGGAVLGVAILGSLLWMSGRHARRSRSSWLEESPEPSPTTAVTREALLPHLARAMRDRLVHVLFAQRGALLENEAAASQRVEELEARLARLQPAIAEKIRAYERRIATLEVEIEEKDKETRDLIRAKLILARQELDAEITRNRLNWN